MFSPDGRLLLTTSLGGSTVWRTATGRRVAELEHRPVRAGTFSSDGRLVATLDASKPRPRVRVFDSSGRLLHVLAPPAELEGVAFSPNGRLLATTSYLGTYLWNPRSGRRVGRLLQDKPGLETDVEFSPDGALLAVAEQDNGVRVWDVASGERVFFLAHHTNPVVAVAWSRDGHFLADASGDGTVDVWKIEEPTIAQRLGSLVGHRSAVTAIAWSPDGRKLLSGGADPDRTARLWDVQFEQQLRRIGAHRGSAVTASFDRRGRRIVSAGADGTARIRDVRSGRRRSLRHQGPVNDAEFSPNGRLVVTASSDRTAGVWDSATGARQQTLQATASVSVATFSPDGTLVATGDARGNVQLWRARDGRLLATGRQRGPVSDAAFAPEGGALATAGGDGASVWSVPAGKRIHLLSSPGGVLRVAFSPDGSLLAGAGQDGAAHVWDAASGRPRGVWRVSKHPLTDVVFSPDGRLLLATGPVVQTRDVGSGRLFRTLVGHTGPVSSGAFSPDGRWIVTAGPSSVGLWQRNGDRPYSYLKSGGSMPKDKRFTTASFSPDGRFVLSSREDGSVGLYRCEVCGDLRALLRLAKARLAELHR